MIDIFLVKLEPEYQSYKIAPPFGILYLASALEKENFKVKLYHNKGTPKNIKSLVEDILKNRPLFVGLSSLTGPSLIPTLTASQMIKKNSDIPVVWGGLHSTMLPEQTLENENIDIIVRGEGEVTVVELAKILSERGCNPYDLKNIKGIGYKKNGKIKVNPLRPFIKDLDNYSPAWHHIDIEKYFYKGKFFYSEFGSKLPGDKIAAVLTSRGCPWRCAFCYNQFVNNRNFRAHSAQKIVRDIKSLEENHEISALVFEDDNFFTDKNRALEIIKNIHTPFSTSIRANYIAQWGEEFVQELSKQNCIELRIGAESGSQRVLDIMQKDITVDDIYKTVRICKKFDINPITNFMVGVPGESESDVMKTFDLMDELEISGNIVNGPSFYFPYPGTPLFDTAVKKGFSPPKKIEDWGVQWGPSQPSTPFVDQKIKFAGYYRILAFRKEKSHLKFPFFVNFLKLIAKKRWEKRFFAVRLDYYIPKFILNVLKTLKLKNIARMIYD